MFSRKKKQIKKFHQMMKININKEELQNSFQKPSSLGLNTNSRTLCQCQSMFSFNGESLSVFIFVSICELIAGNLFKLVFEEFNFSFLLHFRFLKFKINKNLFLCFNIRRLKIHFISLSFVFI